MTGILAVKHTPGPWAVEADGREPGDDYEITAVGGEVSVAVVDGADAFPCLEDAEARTTYDHEAAANATLIAAAPDLLAACERGLAALRSALDAACLGEGADVDALVAAIEKARAK